MRDPTMTNTGRSRTSTDEWSFLPPARRGGQGQAQQLGLVPQLATQLGVAPTPRLEAPRDGVEQPGFV